MPDWCRCSRAPISYAGQPHTPTWTRPARLWLTRRRPPSRCPQPPSGSTPRSWTPIRVDRQQISGLQTVVTAAPALSKICAGWAQTAGFEVVTEDGATTLRPQDRNRGSYQILSRGRGRVELVETDQDGTRTSALFAADMNVLEHYILAILGDEVRDQLDLDYLEMPWTADEVHPQFTLSAVENCYQTLRRLDGSPVAAARYEAGRAGVSLSKLVPLSHCLAFDLPTLKRAFLDIGGAPMLSNGRYAAHTTTAAAAARRRHG
ncbi:hypothetical protein FZI93_10925 [Mycobacterium sp. CBMA361]|nr:hypothetical protein [Mycolicibacterium sp. CBMA 361]